MIIGKDGYLRAKKSSKTDPAVFMAKAYDERRCFINLRYVVFDKDSLGRRFRFKAEEVRD
jgi:hypothetical protein